MELEKRNLKSFDLSKLNNKKIIVVSSQDALKDVSPINWSKDVLSGNKKVLISKDNR